MNRVDQEYLRLSTKTKEWLDQVNSRVVDILGEGAKHED